MSAKKAHPLLQDSSDSEPDFHVNNSYAENYNKWRQKEELRKLKDRYGSDVSSSSSESEEDVPLIEEDFLKTLSLLKSKDPIIYSKEATFFTETEEPCVKKPKEKKPKPLFFKDHERNVLLNTHGEMSDDEEMEAPPIYQPSYDEEQREIKESFKMEESDDDDDSKLLQVRKKDMEEEAKEEVDYISWLKGEKTNLTASDKGKDLKFLKDFWNGPKLDADEKFLRDYILNARHMDNNDDNDSDHIPTYDEITKDVTLLSEDEETIKRQEEFEHKYNFRFEEPDAEFIKQYPRTINDSLRKMDNRRKLKREEVKERKKQEKEQKREEIKRLKALKRKEIEERISKLKEITGNDQLGFEEFDLNDDFDPSEHDKKMQALFNDDYYNVEEEERPEFPYDEELECEDWNNWHGENNDDYQAPDCEDPNFNMDADYDPKLDFERQMIQSTQSKRKKKKSKFGDAVSKSKPLFDPSSKSFEQYFDEYYKLDYEDIIGDLPVRFKYRRVVPNDFGLSTDEILKANDRELNRWCSLKKACQYRTDNEEQYDVQAFKKRAENPHVKKKVFISLFVNEDKGAGESSCYTQSPEKTSRKRKRRKIREENNENGYDKSDQQTSSKNDETPVCSDASQSKVDASETSSFELNAIQTTIKTNKEKEHPSKLASVNTSQNAAQQPNELQTDNSMKSSSKKRKKKKKRNNTSSDFTNSSSLPSKKQNVHHQKRKQINDKRLELSDARLQAYGINPKKFKNRIIFSKMKKDKKE